MTAYLYDPDVLEQRVANAIGLLLGGIGAVGMMAELGLLADPEVRAMLDTHFRALIASFASGWTAKGLDATEDVLYLHSRLEDALGRAHLAPSPENFT